MHFLKVLRSAIPTLFLDSFLFYLRIVWPVNDIFAVC